MSKANLIHNANLDRGIPKTKLIEMLASDPDGPERRMTNKSTPDVEQARKQFQDAADSVLAASANMNAAFESTTKAAKAGVSRAKDQAAQVADALNRITKMVGPDFEKRLDQLVTLTDCLERLAALDKAGRLEPLIKALR
jgi:hypothetical protein